MFRILLEVQPEPECEYCTTQPSTEGALVGNIEEGAIDDGATLGIVVGETEGIPVSSVVGATVGSAEGAIVGAVGLNVRVGESVVGTTVGVSKG